MRSRNTSGKERNPSLLREQKYIPCGFAARESRKGREANPLGGSVGGSQDPLAMFSRRLNRLNVMSVFRDGSQGDRQVAVALPDGVQEAAGG